MASYISLEVLKTVNYETDEFKQKFQLRNSIESILSVTQTSFGLPQPNFSLAQPNKREYKRTLDTLQFRISNTCC